MKDFKIFAPLIDLFKKEEFRQKSDKIIYNGDQNDYAEKVELFIENSVTSTSASNVFKRFLLGLGSEELKNWRPNSYQKGDELLDQIAEDYKDHRGFALLVTYNPLGEVKEFHHVPFTDVRKENVDSNSDATRFLLCKNWHNIGQVKKAEKYSYFTYNPDPVIVENQIKKAGGFNKFKGQIFFWHGSKPKLHYPLSFIHPVMNDADTEFRIQIHRNKRIRGGMLNKKIMITPPTLPDRLDIPDSSLTSQDLQLKRDFLQKKQDVDYMMQQFVSAENNEGLLRLELQYEGDDIDKIFKVIDIKAESEDGYFKNNEDTIKRNIRSAYFNIPPILIDSDNSFFGSSGEAMREAKEFYEENVKHERLKFQRALSQILPFEVVLQPLINVNLTTEGNGNTDNNSGVQSYKRSL